MLSEASRTLKNLPEKTHVIRMYYKHVNTKWSTLISMA